MDILAHALWTNLLFYEADTSTRIAAIALSVMPDIVPFAPTTIKSIFTPVKRDPSTGKVATDSLDFKFSLWAYRGYDLTHSIPNWLVFFGLFWWVLGSMPLAMFGWLVHILVDIPTHRRSFFGTPFLWPFSKYRFDGISWGERWFMRANYASLAALYVYLIIAYWVDGGA